MIEEGFHRFWPIEGYGHHSGAEHGTSGAEEEGATQAATEATVPAAAEAVPTEVPKEKAE